MRVSMNNVDKFFQSIADKPAKMKTGEDWPNMAVIAAYRAAGRDQEADTLTTARDIYEQRREAEKEAWRKKYAAQQTYYNSPKPKSFSDLTELEKAQYMMEVAQECANEHPEMDWSDILEKAAKRLEKAKAERQERYNARCKELEAEALAQMPYKVGDIVKSRDGVTGRVIEMYPEVTGDIDNPHLIYEYDGKPTVNVVILDADGKRHCAHWSFFTLLETPEITDTQTAQDFADALEIKTGDRVLSKHFQTMGTVTGIYEWNGGTCYDVTLDKAVRGFSGETITKTAFRRYGITKNYYPQGTAEIVCNALYYAEELQAGFWGTDSKPRRFQFENSEVEVFAPTDRRPSWLLVADIFSQPQEMTLQQVAEYLARRYQEANRLPEPPAEITLAI